VDLVSATLPVLDDIDALVRVRFIARPLIDQTKAMDKTCDAVVPFILGDVPPLRS
jgi:hypothetical protein